ARAAGRLRNPQAADAGLAEQPEGVERQHVVALALHGAGSQLQRKRSGSPNQLIGHGTRGRLAVGGTGTRGLESQDFFSCHRWRWSVAQASFTTRRWNEASPAAARKSRLQTQGCAVTEL